MGNRFKDRSKIDRIDPKLFEMLYPNKYLQQRLETAIIDETKLSDDASAELRSIRQKITRSGLKIRETLDKIPEHSEIFAGEHCHNA